ncbi:MAG: hypothetical protein U0521_29320 [Anaerolineae bacterium]
MRRRILDRDCDRRLDRAGRTRAGAGRAGRAAVSQVARSTHPCITTDESCLRFPVVTGENLPGQPFTLPADFSGEAVLVVVPFDERQQVDAAELAAAGARTHRERPRLHLLRRAGLSEHVRADAGADSRRHGADHRR